MLRILDGIYEVHVRTARVYLIEGNDGLTLIDTGVTGALPLIEKELATINHTIGEIKRILITHAHYDHYGSLAALQAATSAETYAHHRYESEVIRGEKPALRPDPSQLHGFAKMMGRMIKIPQAPSARVDHELHEGDRLDDVLPGLEVIDSPGHSLGHCSFWQPAQRLLFAGDAIINLPTLNTPMSVFTPDMDEAKRSFRKLAELDVNTLCMGHGNPIVRDAGSALRKRAGKL